MAKQNGKKLNLPENKRHMHAQTRTQHTKWTHTHTHSHPHPTTTTAIPPTTTCTQSLRWAKEILPENPSFFSHCSSSQVPPLCHLCHPPCHLRHPFCHLRHPPCHLRHPPCHLCHPPCHLCHPHCHLCHPSCHLRHPSCHLCHLPCHLHCPPCHWRQLVQDEEGQWHDVAALGCDRWWGYTWCRSEPTERDMTNTARLTGAQTACLRNWKTRRCVSPEHYSLYVD